LTSAIDGPALEEDRRTTLIGYAIAVVATAVAALAWWGARVALECRRPTTDSLTPADRRQQLPPEAESDDLDTAVPSSLDVAELTRRMGGTLTREAAPGADVRFAIWLSTKASSSLVERPGPVTLWPPIAFELPRAP
jgi:hypothetical protein